MGITQRFRVHNLNKPAWWGGSKHTTFTVIVFVILASLDNVAIGVVPPLIKVIAQDLAVSEGSVGIVTATSIFVTSITAMPWGYMGDLWNRKTLLVTGTIIWTSGSFFTGLSTNYLEFLSLQIITAIGLGCILSVGFSVITDFVSPRRRGLAMSFWGISQGIGLIAGNFLVVLSGTTDWAIPFFVVSGAGVIFGCFYIFAFDPNRGRSEPELTQIPNKDIPYKYRISKSDIPDLASTETNIWLILQGFTAQFAYGSLVWIPVLMQGKVEALGYSTDTAVSVGTLFAIIFQTGGLFAILSGHFGDSWALRDPRGRAYMSAIGILGAIPFFLALFFLPLNGLLIPEHPNLQDLFTSVLSSFFNSPLITLAFFLSLMALALTSADSPNWFAMISDVNLPERRGTVFGIASFTNGSGRALGNGLTGMAFDFFKGTGRFPPPWNYAICLSLFQVFFIPTGWCYFQASKSISKDMSNVKSTLRSRAQSG